MDQIETGGVQSRLRASTRSSVDLKLNERTYEPGSRGAFGDWSTQCKEPTEIRHGNWLSFQRFVTYEEFGFVSPNLMIQSMIVAIDDFPFALKWAVGWLVPLFTFFPIPDEGTRRDQADWHSCCSNKLARGSNRYRRLHMVGEDRTNAMPAVVRRMLARPSLMAGENRTEYDELVGIVRREVRPQDLQEWVLMLDIVEADWELLRLRGLKVGMLHAAIPRALNSQISDTDGVVPTAAAATLRKHLIGMLGGDQAAREKLDTLLATHDLNWDLLTAIAFEANIVPQVHTNRMAVAARERRNAAYADLERLRARKASSAIKRTEDLLADDAAVDAEAPPMAPGGGAVGHNGQYRATGQSVEPAPDGSYGR